MTLADAGELVVYWQECPPTHVSLAAFVRGIAGEGNQEPGTPQPITAPAPGRSEPSNRPSSREELEEFARRASMI